MGLALLTSPAVGQLDRLDPATARSVTLSDQQRQQVAEWVDAHAIAAFGADPAESARAVDELLRPLREPEVSVAFRQAMAERLLNAMTAAVADDRAMVEGADGLQVVNPAPYAALRLAGEIATESTLSLLRGGLSESDDGRRFFAIYATETVFYTVSNSAPAVTPSSLYSRRGEDADGLVAALAQLLEREGSARHAGAVVRALAEAASIRDEQFAEASRAALELIGRGASARVRENRRAAAPGTAGPDRDERLVWMSAGQALVRSIAQGGGDGAAGLEAIRLAGHLVASLYRDQEADRLAPPADREGPAGQMERQTLQLAQNLLTFGDQAHARATGRTASRDLEATSALLLDAYLVRGDQNLRQVALSLVSTNGLLTGDPFGFKDNEFIGE